jgi:hypothetical protein
LIECQSCHTLNPDAERACLACGVALPRAAATGFPAQSARCPAGHPIDPTWRSCPYCERQQAVAGTSPAVPAAGSSATAPIAPGEPRRTRLDEPAPPVQHAADRRTRLDGEAPAPPPAPAGPRRTRLDEPEPSGRRTLLHEAPAASPSPLSSPLPAEPSREPALPGDRGAPGRRLVAVLAAPGLGPGGMVFPIRSGKTSIGADRGSDVLLASDTEVSSEHALILHRNATFHLADRLSTNGTWLNGEEVPANGTVPLRDRDRIRCGRTELLFLTIETGDPSVAGTPNA